MSSSQYFIMCVLGEMANPTRVSRDLLHLFGEYFSVEISPTAKAASDRLRVMARIGRKAALLVFDSDTAFNSEGAFLFGPDVSGVPRVCVSDPSDKARFTRAHQDTFLPFEIVYKPVETSSLGRACRKLLTDYFAKRETSDLVRMSRVLDVERLSEDFLEMDRERDSFRHKLQDFQTGLLRTPWKTDEELVKELVDRITAVMDINKLTCHFPAGEVFLQENEPNYDVFIVVSGTVQLSKDVDGETVDLGKLGPGKFIGLLSFIEGKTLFTSSTAVTDVTMLKLNTNDMRRLMASDAALSSLFFNKMSRSMSERIREQTMLQLEIRELNRTLTRERDELKDTLQRLEHAETKLLQSEKMAVLGQFVAGIAHELNNPAGAMQRGVDHLAESLEVLVNIANSLCINDAARVRPFGARLLKAAATTAPKALADIRKATRRIEPELKPHPMRHDHARMLAELQCEPAEVLSLVKNLKEQDRAIVGLHHYHEVGRGLYQMRVSAERVESIVKGLRNYSRPDPGENVAFDVHEGLDNTLVILGHLLKQYNIERSYGILPLVFGRPGSTNQVWTNLLANAAEALAGEGTIRISTAVHDDEFVRVSIEDDGRGIPPDCLEKIWEINYTTKKSSSNFGLGLGLAISRSIIEEQGGRIWAEASPGHTVFHTLLPIATRLED